MCHTDTDAAQKILLLDTGREYRDIHAGGQQHQQQQTYTLNPKRTSKQFRSKTSNERVLVSETPIEAHTLDWNCKNSSDANCWRSNIFTVLYLLFGASAATTAIAAKWHSSTRQPRTPFRVGCLVGWLVGLVWLDSFDLPNKARRQHFQTNTTDASPRT